MTFKEIIESYGKQLAYSCMLKHVTTEIPLSEEDIISVNPHFDGALYTSVMRCLDVVLKGDYRSVKKGWFIRNNKFTVKKDGAQKTINYGTYIVAEAPEYDDKENSTKLICYDLMFTTMQEYQLEVTYPITVGNYLERIAEVCGFTVANIEELKNADMLIGSEMYLNVANDTGSSYTYRDVLDDIARCTGCSLVFKSDANGETVDELYIVYVTDGNGNMKAPLYTLDISNFKTLTIGEKYGPVNSVVFSRQPQEDNVYLLGDGVTENNALSVKFRQPLIAEGTDTEREAWLPEILKAVKGTEYQCYALDSFGIGYLNFGDVFKIKAFARNGLSLDYSQSEEYLTVFMRSDMLINGDVKESTKIEMPVATSTDYKAGATEAEKRLFEAYMKVDKQLGEIVAVVKDPVNGLETMYKQTAEGFKTQAAKIETLTTKYNELSEDFSNLDIAGTVTTEIQKETTLELIAGKIEGKITGNYVSKSDLNDYVKTETLTAQSTLTEEKITDLVKRTSVIEKAGYITEDEAQGLIDVSTQNITLAVTENMKRASKNLFIDSECFESATADPFRSELLTDKVITDAALPLRKVRQIGFWGELKATYPANIGFTLRAKDTIGQEAGSIDKLKAGTSYALSFKAKCTRSGISLSIPNFLYVGQGITAQIVSNSSFSFTSANEWQDFTIVFRLSDNPTDFSLRFFINTSNQSDTYVISFSSFMLVESETPVEWVTDTQWLEQVVEAKIDLCVKTDENGNLVSAIHAKANKITIESDYFELSENGEITASGGHIGGWKIESNELSSTLEKVYSKPTQEDLTLMTDLSTGVVEITAAYLDKYDYNDDGVINATDTLFAMNLMSKYDNYKKDTGTIKFNPGAFRSTILISGTKLGGVACPDTRIGVGTVQTGAVICENITTENMYFTKGRGATSVSGKSYALLAVEVKTGEVITVST